MKGRMNPRIFEKFDSISETYAEYASEDNLNTLLAFYQKLVPTWVKDYNELQKRLMEDNNVKGMGFDDFLNVQLPENYSVRNLKAPKNEKKSVVADIMNRGRIIHLSNKIAHQFEYMLESVLREYMIKNGIRANTKEQFNQIKRLIKKVYRSTSKENVKEEAKAKLQREYGFKDTDFAEGKNLDTLMLPELIKAYSDGMYIKDMEIERVSSLIRDNNRQDISYGLRRESDDDILFVMDVIGFGQFSVHVKNPSLIAQIKTNYEMPIYRKKTAMLVKQLSPKARQFINDAKADDSLDEERSIPEDFSESQKQRARLVAEIRELDLPKGAKHDIAVKAGLRKKGLEYIDTEDKEER